MSEVRTYRQKPVECEAMKLEGYGSFTRARDWINANGGHARHHQGGGTDILSIFTIDGNLADVFEGWYVVRGITYGEFYPCRNDIFEASHEAVEVPETEALTGTGSYVVGRPSSDDSLKGGAAKAIPRHHTISE